jgi:hypothetical protein
MEEHGMEFIFTANTPEEFRQEIVKFLQRQIDHETSLVTTTNLKRVVMDIQAATTALTAAKDLIAGAKIEPTPGPRCIHCKAPIHRVKPGELPIKGLVEEWIHDDAMFSCNGGSSETEAEAPGAEAQ